MSPGKYIVFSLGAEMYGIPIERVEQILNSSPVTRIPKAPKEMLGVLSLRGDTLPVVDTWSLLGLSSDQSNCFLVVSIDGVRLALAAQQVDRIHDFTEDQIEPAAEIGDGALGASTGRIGNRLVVLLEPEELIPRRRLV